MKLFPVPPILWSSLLVLWVLHIETEGSNSDVCQEEKHFEQLRIQDSSAHDYRVEKTDVKETFICLLHPTNVLNCSWSFHTLEKDTQLSVFISICEDDITVESLNHTSVERVGSMSLILSEQHNLHEVILYFNMSLHDKWTAYTYVYEKEVLEVLSPPPNISVLIRNGSLNVAWNLPVSQSTVEPGCFEYQLDMGDQQRPRNFSGLQSYTEPNADPTRTYRVRMRTRMAHSCYGGPEWSDWSPTVTLEQSAYKLNLLVIISISLGIPMILLAVLLLVRHQRLPEVLFPPIPRPPAKYKYFLEKNETFSFFKPDPSPKPEEEITEVEDAEQNPGKMF